jgi:hypothetical protein
MRPPVRWWPAGSAATCPGCGWGGLTAEEALALERPAMTYVRGQLGDRLHRQLARAWWRWRHPSSRRRAGNRLL